MSSRPTNGSLHGEPHLDLLLVILRRIRDREKRLAWVVENLPRTSTTLGIAVDWEALGVLHDDGKERSLDSNRHSPV